MLLYGPSGSGKTELVHALASEIGANLLYVPAGDLLKSYQEQGQRLLRALFKVRCCYCRIVRAMKGVSNPAPPLCVCTFACRCNVAMIVQRLSPVAAAGTLACISCCYIRCCPPSPHRHLVNPISRLHVGSLELAHLCFFFSPLTLMPCCRWLDVHLLLSSVLMTLTAASQQMPGCHTLIIHHTRCWWS